MKLFAVDSSAAQVEWGSPYPVKFGLNPDLTVEVPAFCAPGLIASGKFYAVPVALPVDIREELAKAAGHEIDIYLNTKGIHTHYFNAHSHPLSEKARSADLIDVADELDKLYQQLFKGGRGVIAVVPLEQKRDYALAYFDAEKAGKMPPKVPWR